MTVQFSTLPLARNSGFRDGVALHPGDNFPTNLISALIQPHYNAMISTLQRIQMKQVSPSNLRKSSERSPTVERSTSAAEHSRVRDRIIVIIIYTQGRTCLTVFVRLSRSLLIILDVALLFTM